MQLFTEYVRSLDPTGEPAIREDLYGVLEGLRTSCRRELRRRGLLDHPPSFLGFEGWRHWQEPGPKLGTFQLDALGDLASTAYLEIFVRRLTLLQRYVAQGSTVEAVIHKMVGDTIYELQRRHDPLGFRLFQALRAALRRLVEGGELRVVSGPSIGNGSVLAFGEQAKPLATPEVLEAGSRSWNDRLLPDIVTARGRELKVVYGRLAACVVGLLDMGVIAFGFKALIDPWKADVRGRWGALWAPGPDEVGLESGDGQELDWVPLVQPDSGLENRDYLDKLVRCVDRQLEGLPGQRRTRDHRTKLWRFLAAEPLRSGGVIDERLPSHRELGKRLGIPRERFPELFETLRRAVKKCGHSLGTPSNAGASDAPQAPKSQGAAPARGLEVQTMDPEALAEELLTKTAEAHRRGATAEEASDDGDWLGKVFSTEGASGDGLGWLVIDERAPGRWAALAVDPRIFVGSADVVVEAGALSLSRVRCGRVFELPTPWLVEADRLGALGAEDFERVLSRRRVLEDPAWEASLGEQETDLDPDYQEWLETIEAAARTVAEDEPLDGRGRFGRPAGAPRNEESGSSGEMARGPRLAQGLAWAASLVFLVGLSALYLAERRHSQALQERLTASGAELAESSRLVTDLERRVDALEDERDRLQGHEVGEWEAIVAEKDAALQRLEGTVAGLRTRLGTVLEGRAFGVPFLSLGRDRTLRGLGGLPRLEIPDGEAWVNLVLTLPRGRSVDEFQALGLFRLEERGGELIEERLWRRGGAGTTGRGAGTQFSMVLPAEDFPTSPVRLKLVDTFGEAVSYSFEVVRLEE